MYNAALKQVESNEIAQYSNNPEKFLKWVVKNLPIEKVVMGAGFGPPGIVLLDMLFLICINMI